MLLIMELRFAAILYSRVITIRMRAITNVHEGLIWPTGRWFPTPAVKRYTTLIRFYMGC